MNKSIFLKIFMSFFLITLILSAVIILFSSKIIKQHYINTLTERLDHISIAISKDVRNYLEKNSIKELNDYVKSLGYSIKTRITVIDNTGIVLADSEKDPMKMNNHSNRPEVITALKGEGNKALGVGTSIRYSNTVREKMLYFAVPVINSDGSHIWVLRLSLFLEQVDVLINELIGKIINISLITLILSLMVAFIISKKITDPIRNLGEAAIKVASRDFDVNLTISSKDELGRTAESFNFMTSEIKNLVNEISSQKEELNAIISSMREGLLVINKEGRVILSNKSFSNIVEMPEVSGKFYYECLMPQSINDHIEKSARDKKDIMGQAEINSRTFLYSITFVREGLERVIMFYDITGIKEFETIKKDFVANVSHELKTPLTAIKGFAETLEEEITDEDNRHYIDIIMRHTERLINIVEDLLLLSNLEKRDTKEDFAEVNISEIIHTTLKIFKDRIKTKNLVLNSFIDEDLKISGDVFKLEQLFINLVDNSVKYTEKGEITVYVHKEGDRIIAGVKDTGVGIPEESQSRIYERFYVTDKSRSRKVGGTGLGLSIVKHIVLLHNAEIRLISEQNKGSEFIISFPCV